MLDKDISLGEKIRTLFREQGITIASILTAIGMAIGVLVEALLSGGLKEWVKNKLKALASLLEKLGMKAAEALPGIIGGIISWILNRAKRCSWLGITKSVVSGCGNWRINLYVYGNEKVVILRIII